LTIFVDGVKTGIEEALELLSGGRCQNLMYPIMITNGLLWEPANNEKNLLAAILWRTHNDPFVGYEDVKVRVERWRNLAEQLCEQGLFNTQIQHLLTIEQCVKLMGKRGLRIANANKQMIDGEIFNMRKTISLKWNETLSVDKDLNGVSTMKPRAIINLDPRFHSEMTIFSRALTYVLHDIFDGSSKDYFGVQARIYFAAGSPFEVLCEIGTSMSTGDLVIAVSGDDSVVAWGNNFRFQGYGEADQSQFDHTQDQGPQTAAAIWMRALGAPGWFVDMVYHCCSAAYTVNFRRLRVKGEAGVQMPTGITMTTLLNSMSTIFMYLNLFKNPGLDVPLAGRQLGFKVKYFEFVNLGDVTFLKGWWRRSGSSLIWLPLPSAVLKIGKILKKPTEIVRMSPNKKKSERGQKLACYEVGRALASSYGSVPFSYPILGPFLHVLKKFHSTCEKGTAMAATESWKPCVTGDYELESEAIDAVCFRYGLSTGDIDRVTKLILQVADLPSYLEDLVFLRLAEKDY
jgi:hypothetical protein